MTFSWAVKVFSHFHGFTNWKQTLKGKKFEQKRILEKGERERGRFCVIQMRFAIVGQARNEQQQPASLASKASIFFRHATRLLLLSGFLLDPEISAFYTPQRIWVTGLWPIQPSSCAITMYLYFESICIYERLTDVLDLMLVVAISKIPVATLGGLTRELVTYQC